ncbi:MAG: glycosyltransferase family 4 protein [Anaerolineae bacterium]
MITGSAPPPELQSLRDAIIVSGHVPDMRTYLETAAVFVCPLRLGAGIKNKVLEALALACPLVATPLSVDGIAVRDAGHDALIAETDNKQIAAAVLRLLADAALRDQLGANGRADRESRYSWGAGRRTLRSCLHRGRPMSSYTFKTVRELGYLPDDER